jgi:cytochrome c biogenesis protein CcdA
VIVAELGSLALGYVAGALSTLSPCVLPLLPIVLIGSFEQHAWGPVALAAGLSVSFAAVGVFIASVGFTIGLDPAVLRLGVAALMIVVGVVLLVPAFQAGLAVIAAPMSSGGQALLARMRPSGIGGQALLGVVLGAVWSPCSGPTLGAAVGLAAQSETIGKAAAVMTVFGLGASTPILALAYGSRQMVAARRERLAQLSRIGKPLMGAVLVGVGGLVLTGLDKIIEAALTRAMPDWLVTVTTRF